MSKIWVSTLLMAAGLFGATRDAGRYAVILEDEPAARQTQSRNELRSAAGVAVRARIRNAQDALRPHIESRRIPITGASQTLLNAIYVQATAEQAADLAKLPGVKGVVPLHRYRLHMDRAAGLVNAPAAWQAMGGVNNAGAGVKVAIIDTGIDNTHPAFQDSSLKPPAGFPICTGGDCAFVNSKVIVARSYVALEAAGSASNPAADSRPDDLSPRDHIGHGTALGMIVAGVTNTSNAATITGMAPKAWLGNYKVFGSPGLNDGASGDAIIHALEDALHDGMDIAVMSLGSAALSGPLDQGAVCGVSAGTPCDAEAAAVEQAVRSGLLVVASAGNSGDSGQRLPTLNTVESPAGAPSAIAVGATTNSHAFYSTVRVEGDEAPAALKNIAAEFGDGPQPLISLTAPAKDVTALDGNGSACARLAAGSLSGAIALIMRTPSVCTFATKMAVAQAAGAVGVIFIQQAGDNSLFAPSGLSGSSIPAVMVRNDDGAAIRNFAASHPNAQVTLDTRVAAFDTAAYNTVATFSSHGPSISGLLKPEIAAVGDVVYTATQSYDWSGAMYDASRYIAVSGTSFSAPMVAGAAALVKQKFPNFTPAQIKSALVNSATQDVTEGTAAASTIATGGGKLNAAAALNALITADPATVSFGMLDRTATLPLTRQLAIHWAGTSTAALTLTVVPASASQMAPTLDRATLDFTPGQADQSVTLTLSGTVPSAGLYSGVVQISGGGVTIRVPYQFVVGDGVAADIIPLVGDGFDGVAGDYIPEGFVLFKVIDRYGVPVKNLAVQWSVTRGLGRLTNVDTRTDDYGMAGANAILGLFLGTQQFAASAGGLSVTFTGTSRQRPTIYTNGITNAASFASGAIVPGSYISLFGNGLSDYTAVNPTSYLPVSLVNVGVSFDVPSAGISLPGRIIAISAGQINVQVPWELQGQTAVSMKVNIGWVSGQVVQASITTSSPAFYTSGSTVAAALDEAYQVATAANPVKRGHVVQLFANGLGAVDNPPATGEVASASVLARTLETPAVTIGGKPATVLFSGLAPGFPCLYQVNVLVPDDAPTGTPTVVMTMGGATSPAVTLPVQ